MNLKVSLIVAIAENDVIGRDNSLPWQLSEDLKNFKRITMGKPMIMGRKTFESLGAPLPGRPHIVLTRDQDYRVPGHETAQNFEQALVVASKETSLQDGEIMVIGGERVFREALSFANRLYLTEVHMTVDGDVKFPKFNRKDWLEISRKFFSGGPQDSCDYSFVVLVRAF
ncbi:MAG: dihydrofolate reductase [Pseudomonadota bacterium]|nr:dihydrofolate reductase [Pseudomonadota bacterium]